MIPTSFLVRSLLIVIWHLFFYECYARLHNTKFGDMPTSMVMQTPGSKWKTCRVSHGNEILVDRLVFLASLIALMSSDINIILGMDWMSAHYAKIDCATRTVQLTHPSGKTVNVLTRVSKRQLYSLNASPLLDLEDIPVVRDFPDVFPEELPGVPPDRDVEFVIDHYKKYTSVMIRACHSRSRFLSCMYIHDDFMTESR